MTIPENQPLTARPPRWRWLLLRIALPMIALLAILLLALGAFPVGLARGLVESRLSSALKTQVQVGSITRDSVFSYTPSIALRDVRIAQPVWAGPGDFIRVDTARVRVPVFSLLLGTFRPDRVAVDGARIVLVRDATGRANWKPDGPKPTESKGGGLRLSDLTVTNTQIVLRDAKRGLIISGPLTVDAARGLHLSATGTFLDTPATLDLTGGRIFGIDPAAPYPFAATLVSPALGMTVKGSMDGVLDTAHFKANITARAPTLRNVDRIIEAGLFGTQPVAITGAIRHDGRDWYIDRIDGAIGRSRFTGVATVHKVDVRTKIDARLHATQLDFDDLADTAGQAASARRRASIGPRVIPPTRINLAKLWKTDGTIRVTADRLLSKGGTAFRSLSATINLDHKMLRVTDVVATLVNGRMTGLATVDHRSGRPKLTLDLRLAGLTLEELVGKPEMVSGQVRGHVVLSGQGDTVREALSHASGKAAIVATQGSVKRIVADVLGQNLSGAIAHAIGGPSAHVPLRCLVANFRATNGVLVPRPLGIDTGTSVGRGAGRIVLDGERVALTLAGTSKSRALLRIADPIRIGGTLSQLSLSVAGAGTTDKPTPTAMLKVFGRSLGRALGLAKTPPNIPIPPPATFACASAVAEALR